AHPLALRTNRIRAANRVALSLLCASLFGFAPSLAAQPTEHGLDIRAQGFSFNVKEPRGWLVDSTIAREFAAHVILYPVAGDPRSPRTPLIRLIVWNKD